MKQIVLSIAIVIAVFFSNGPALTQMHLVNYEAAKWKPRLVDTKKIRSTAPPAGAALQAELKKLKELSVNPDSNKPEEIRYWNAGAPAYRWNQIGPALGEGKANPWIRVPTAWMNIAIYDATILAWREKVKYKRKRPHHQNPSIKPVIDAPLTYSYPCEHSVTAAAAATILAYFYPEKADSILQVAHRAAQSRVEAGVQYPSDILEGWNLGEQVAKQIIEIAKNDGSTAVWDGNMNKDPKKWTGKFPFGITLASFKPIVLRSGDQFRPGPPPDFENEMKDLKNFTPTFKSSSLAYYWANNGGFDFWSREAGLKMFEHNMMNDAPAVARIYTILHTAYHDAVISIMDAKYAYWGIRPSQYDTAFKPLLATPPFPGYPSGHAAGAATTATVLEYFFPADRKYFQQLAQDCADSRFYAGIHFRIDNETGLNLGKAVGKYLVERWVKQ